MSTPNPTAAPPAQILVVDDEPDLRTLYELTLLREGYRVEAAGNVTEALQHLDAGRFDAVITDMRLPDGLGMEILQRIQRDQRSERCVVMTAYGSAENAVEALKAGAFDYLTKPVRAERLQPALQKAERFLKERRGQLDDPNEEVLYIQERGRAERVPLSEVVYLKSEFKYLTVRTPAHSYIYDGSLNDMEERYPSRFVRVHRNALVARSAMRALEKYDDGEDVDGWALRLRGISEPVVVSRRQLTAVREALKDPR